MTQFNHLDKTHDYTPKVLNNKAQGAVFWLPGKRTAQIPGNPNGVQHIITIDSDSRRLASNEFNKRREEITQKFDSKPHYRREATRIKQNTRIYKYTEGVKQGKEHPSPKAAIKPRQTRQNLSLRAVKGGKIRYLDRNFDARRTSNHIDLERSNPLAKTAIPEIRINLLSGYFDKNHERLAMTSSGAFGGIQPALSFKKNLSRPAIFPNN